MALIQTSQVRGFGHLIGERNNSIESRNTIAPFKTISSEELMRQGTTFEGNAAVEYVAISTQFSALKKSFDIQGVPEDKYTEASVLAFLHLNPKASKEFEQLQPEMAMVTPVGTVIKHSDSFTFVPNPPHRKKDNGPVTISFSRDQIDNVPTTSVHDIERLKLTVGHLAAQVAKRSAITNIRKGPNVGQRGFKRPPNALIATIALVIALYAYAGRDQISAVNKSILNFFGLGNIPVPAEQAAGDEEAAQGSDETSPEGDSYIYPTPTELTESEVPDNTPTPTGPDPDKLKLEAEAARLLAEKVALELPRNAKEINDPLISYTDPNAPKLRLGYPESNIPLATNIGDLMRVANGPNAEENLEIITKSLNGMEPFALYIFESGPFPDGTLPDTLTREALNSLQNAGWQIILTPNRESTTVQDQNFSAHELFSVDPKLPNPRFGIATGTDFSWIYSTDEKYLIIPPSKYPFYMIQEGDEEGKIEISGSLVIGNSIKNIQKWDEFVQSFNPGYESQTYFIRWPVNANAINLKGYEASGMIIIPPNTPPQRLAQLLAEHYGMGIDLNQLMSSILVGTTNIDD